MADLLVGFATGLTLMGSAWAWFDLRRRQRAIDQQHATQAVALALQDAVLVKLQRKVGELSDASYDHARDLDSAAAHGGWARYQRGSKG